MSLKAQKCLLLVACLLMLVLTTSVVGAAPQSFEQAKEIARTKVYADRNQSELGTLYCGCHWRWTEKSGGRIDWQSCGYQVRKNETRANRIEWEHIVPAWTVGHQRQCWQQGGRNNCRANDPVFGVMEADLHNLTPVIGEVNADRSNFNFGRVSVNMPNQYGQCETRTDFKARTTEPRDQAKGLVARVTFYVFDHYGLRMSRQQQQILMAWDKQFPPDAWEIERDQRIAAEMGHHNPFVTGEKEWTLGYRSQGHGLQVLETKASQQTPHKGQSVVPDKDSTALNAGQAVVIGNQRSRLYHLPEGCPGYGDVAQHNQQSFVTEQEAKDAGFKKAGNCRP